MFYWCRLLSVTLFLVLLCVVFLYSTSTSSIVGTGRPTALPKRRSKNKLCIDSSVFIALESKSTNNGLLSCHKLLEGDEVEKRLKLADATPDMKNLSISAAVHLINQSSVYVSSNELGFPLAFVFPQSFLHEVSFNQQHQQVQQLIWLLKHLYRQHNVYCFHVNSKTPEIWTRYIRGLASYFPNILITTSMEDALFTSYQQCLNTLVLNPDLPWKYAVNLKGTELPLATNREIVEVLTSLQGRNVVSYGAKIEPTKLSYYKGIKRNTVRHLAAPFNMTLYTSTMESLSVALSQDFVGMMFRDVRAIELAKYLQNITSSFEVYFTTINHLAEAPGGWVGGQSQDKVNLPHVTKLLPSSLCDANHHSCITTELKWINELSKDKKQTTFFIDKRLETFDHLVIECIKEQLMKRNIAEYNKDCGYVKPI